MTKDDLLEDLDITADELGRIRRAFKDAEFKKLFAEYVDEIADPDNRRLYEQELAQLEAERGIDITFIHPVAGYVIKTVTDGQHKTFINVAECAQIARPQSRCARNEAGQSGLNWSLPYAQSPVRKDYDRKQQLCRVYDVVFHPDTLHLARKNAQFKELVTRTALDAVRSAFAVDVDTVNFKLPKIGFKGTPRSTVIRKRSAKQPERMPEASPLDEIYPPLAAERKATANGRGRQQKQEPETAEALAAEYTEPKYTLVHRKHVEYHELTNELDAKVGAAIPHELVLTVELPLLRSGDDAQLDVTSEAVFVISERPAKYRLRVRLPYAVCEQRGRASFDGTKRRLVVTLPVVRAPLTVAEICGQSEAAADVEQNHRGQLVEVLSEDSSSAEESTSASVSPPPESPEAAAAVAAAGFLDAHCLYELPPFVCENFAKSLLFTLHVKNVDPQTLATQQQSHSLHIRFQSIGAGYFPQHHAFFVRLPEAIRAVQPEVWDNDVIVQLELASGASVEHYEAGLDSDTLQLFECERPTEDVFEDAEDGGADAFGMAEVTDALPVVSSPQKLKQRSFSESHANDMEDEEDEDHDEEEEEEEGDEEEEEEEEVAGQPPSGQTSDKMRTNSECSVDGGGKCLKGILKRRSSSVLSESQSSFDEPCCRSVDLSVAGSIPEECGAEHCKKSVRFDNNIRKLLFRFNSTVAGQRKPKANKRKKKKRCTERRYSEGEASDYDPKQSAATAASTEVGNGGKAAAGSKGAKKAANKLGASTAQHLHDSGVDLREDSAAAEESKCDVNFRSGMIFELDM